MEQKTKYNTAAVDGSADTGLQGADVAITADNSIQSNQLIDMIENSMIENSMIENSMIENSMIENSMIENSMIENNMIRKQYDRKRY